MMRVTWVLLLGMLASNVARQDGPRGPALWRVLQLRGGAADKIVYMQDDTKTGMDGTVKLVRQKSEEDDIVGPFEELARLVNQTSVSAQSTQARIGVFSRKQTTASETGIAPRQNWWDHPDTTREEVGTYLRALDNTFPDADEHTRLNADLCSAATWGRVGEIRELVSKGAQVNAGGAGGSSMWVPLHHAARNCRKKAARTLLDLGAKVNISTWGRWTPLHFSATLCDRATARLLLEVYEHKNRIKKHIY